MNNGTIYFVAAYEQLTNLRKRYCDPPPPKGQINSIIISLYILGRLSGYVWDMFGRFDSLFARAPFLEVPRKPRRRSPKTILGEI